MTTMTAETVRLDIRPLFSLEGRYGTRYDGRFTVDGRDYLIAALCTRVACQTLIVRHTNGRAVRRTARVAKVVEKAMMAAIAASVTPIVNL